MADKIKRKQILELIKQNIAQHGRHVYIVQGGPDPRFAYTIGISQSLGFELILAGAAFYSNDSVVNIINDIAIKIESQRSDPSAVNFEISPGHFFSLRKAHSSWTRVLMLGALDYYEISEVPTFQIVPDAKHLTIDVPNMSEPWNASTEPIWRWLHESWSYPVSSKSTTVTNLEALRGESITEAVRWEKDEWELFAGAGPDVPKDDMRVVPLGTLLAADASLEPVVNLRISEGLWRDSDSEWHQWVKRNQG